MASDATDKRQAEIMSEMKSLGLDVQYRYSGRYIIRSHQSPGCHSECLGLVALEQWLRGFKFRMSIDGYQPSWK